MKRSMKRIIPILLGLVIICSIIWYLFVYDRGFMQDLFLSGARYFEKQGNNKTATWLYQQAYAHSDNDEDVIIELAERFKKIDNYTQAEVVLTNAIAEGGSVNLYIALSKTYVEQDKLIDAVEMLDSVTNPEIKAQLDAMRPAAPVASPEPGYYTDYKTVSIKSGSDSNLYMSTDGDFPSVKNAYQGSVTLVGGENTIYTIAVSDNGLVSAPAYFSYIVGGVIEEVTVSDPVLDRHYRDLLNLTSADKLFSDDLWKITSLTVPEGVEDFSSLSQLTYLETLVIEKGNLNGLQMLSALTQLKSLTISGSPLSATDLSIIAGLPSLEELTLRECSLINISGLAGASHLKTLDLSNNAIKDLSPLSFLSNLTSLNVSSNALTSLSPLSALENLAVLDVSYNSLVSILPLSTCPKLCILSATNNQIAEIPVFDDPTVLNFLNLNNNSISDASNLAKYTSLTSLSIAYNKVSDIRALSVLNQLAFFDFSHNSVSALPTWDKNCALVEINGSNNKISSVSALGGLMQLNNVYLDYNKLYNIDALANCRMLVRVSIYGNYVKDVSKLTAMSVIVNYTPR